MFFFFTVPASTEIYTLSLHDALPISLPGPATRSPSARCGIPAPRGWDTTRSEEHTSELQSPMYLVCRLLLEKKKYRIRELFRNVIQRQQATQLCTLSQSNN